MLQMEKRTIFWHTDLGSPTVSKPYRLKDGSYVFVLPEDIAKAHRLGANPKVDLVGQPAGTGLAHEYQIIWLRHSDDELHRFVHMEDGIGSKPLALE
jgi:hypothetical protein